MVTLSEKVGLMGLLRRLEQDIPTRDAVVEEHLQGIPKDRIDQEYISLVTDLYNISNPRSMRVRLSELAKKTLVDYVERYGSLHQEFNPKVDSVKAEQSYWGKLVKVVPLVPTIMDHAKKAHRLRRQTYQALIECL